MLIDSHMHVFPTADAGRAAVEGYAIVEYGAGAPRATAAAAGTPADAVAALEAAGAECGWALSSFEPPGLPAPPDGARFWPAVPVHPEHAAALADDNRWLCKVSAENRRLRPFVTVHPGVMSASASAAAVAQLADDHGARGVKLHPIAMRTHPEDPGLALMFATCAARRMPVVAHCGPDRDGSGWSTPSAFAPVLAAHPELRLVLAHLGGAAWSTLAEIAARFPQARFDLSEIIAWAGSAHAPDERALAQLIRTVGAGRVLLGSDFPWYDTAATAAQVRALPLLSDAERAAILGENAALLVD
jgi:predicted TIM-barrel fold metal-dependent hydrolase